MSPFETFNKFNVLYGKRYPHYRVALLERHGICYFQNGRIHQFGGGYLPEEASKKVERLKSAGKEAWISEITFSPVIINSTSEESAKRPVYLSIYANKVHAKGYKRFKASFNKFLKENTTNIALSIAKMYVVDKREVKTYHRFVYGNKNEPECNLSNANPVQEVEQHIKDFATVEPGLQYLNKTGRPILQYEVIHELVKSEKK